MQGGRADSGEKMGFRVVVVVVVVGGVNVSLKVDSGGILSSMKGRF